MTRLGGRVTKVVAKVKNARDIASDWFRAVDIGSCFPIGEKSTDIVPFSLQTSTMLADKLVEVPRDVAEEKVPAVVKPAKADENALMRHDQVLQRHRGVSSTEPPKVVEWLEMLDPETKKVYYHNKVTGKSVWKKPEGFDEAIALATKRDEERGSFWIEVQDSRGRTYYYDLLNRETRWDRPANFEPVSAEAENAQRSSGQRLQVM